MSKGNLWLKQKNWPNKKYTKQTMQPLSVKTWSKNMIYTHMINQGVKGVKKPCRFLVQVAKMSNIYKELNVDEK